MKTTIKTNAGEIVNVECRTINQYSNYRVNELIIRNVDLHTMRIYGELNCLNEYGSRYAVADVEVLGTIEEKLSIAGDFFKEKMVLSYEL